MKLTKKDVRKRVSQNGKQLDLDKFNWCEKTRTFSSEEIHLVLDFSNIDNCTFKTGSYCTFNTGSDCTFDTGDGCTFKVESGCTFKVGVYCTFETEYNCAFDTGSNCVVVRRDMFDVITNHDRKMQLYPNEMKGYAVEKDGKWFDSETNKIILQFFK